MAKSLLETELRREDILARLKTHILQKLADTSAGAYLYGSWAKNKEKRSSDIDIAIWYEEDILPGLFAELRLALEESEIPYRVEVVDLTKTDAEFTFEAIWKTAKDVLYKLEGIDQPRCFWEF